MAYASMRLGHVAANRWETWNLSNMSGAIHNGAILWGTISGATAIVMDYGISFSFTINQVILLRYNGVAFNAGETVNIYAVNGGPVVGSFTIAAGGATSTNIHPIVVVTGVDTANLFDYVMSASAAGGWGYETSFNTYGQLDCSIMVGNPFQVAITTAVSKNEALKHNGGLWTLGNSSFSTTFTIGEGTYGDVGSCRNGSVIDNTLASAPVQHWGSGRYGKMNIFASYISKIHGGWAMDMTDVVTYDIENLGSLEFIMFPISQVGYDVSDKIRVYNCTAGGGLLLAHGDMNFESLFIGKNGSYGMILFGPGTFTARNLVILDSTPITDCFGFIASGLKIFVDCVMDETDVTGFWSNYNTEHKFSVRAQALTPGGAPVQNVRVRGWDGDQSLPADAATPDFDVNTNVTGDMVTQECRYATNGEPAVYHNYNPWKFFVNIAGMKEKLFDQTLIEATTFELTMENIEKDFE